MTVQRKIVINVVADFQEDVDALFDAIATVVNNTGVYPTLMVDMFTGLVSDD